MANFDEEPTEAEALQFKKEHDERVDKAREGMGYKKAEEKAPVEEKSEIETETPEEETETEEVETSEDEVEPEEESEDESDDTDEVEDSQPRDKSVFRQLNEIRSQKRASDTKAKLAEEKAAAAETEKTKLLEEIQNLKKNQPPPQPFVEYAKRQGIEDPKQVVEMYDLFKNQMEEDFGARINKLDETIKGYEAKEIERAEQGAYQESMSHLTDEWSKVTPLIESEYKPNATQLDEAFSLMADLAHEKKYVDKELDYILYKESEKFEQIFGARKRRSMFSSHGRASSSESKAPTKRDGSHESIMALRREQKAKIAGGDGFSTVDGGEI